MTRNLFLGADLTPAYRALAAPGGPAELPAAIAAIFNPGDPPGLVQRTDFAARVPALADEIEAARPDLVGLQEAAVWRAGDVSSDHLELLEAELARRGLPYRRAGVKVNGDVTLPSAAGIAVGLVDREAILVRDAPELEVSGVHEGAFATALPLETAQGTFFLARGWLALDARVGATAVRFVTTHLEVARPSAAGAVQLRQVEELLEGPASVDGPVVMVGDFNSRPGGAAYERLRAAGFDDAWLRATPGNLDGFTCCHRPPLDDPRDRLRARIDLILTRGDLVATEAFRVGADAADFKAGLWPSDHAGVTVTLEPV